MISIWRGWKMAVISKRVCDRCGEEITGRERRIAKLYKKIRILHRESEVKQND